MADNVSEAQPKINTNSEVPKDNVVEQTSSSVVEQTKEEPTFDHPTSNTDEPPFIESLPKIIQEMDIFKGINSAEDFSRKVEALVDDKMSDKENPVPEDYSLEIEGLDKDDATLINFKEMAKNSQLTQKQATSIIDFWKKVQIDSINKTKQQYTQVEDEMKKEWGSSYESNLKIAQGALRHFGGDDLVKHLNSTGLGNDSRMIHAFYNIGKAMSEDSFVKGKVSDQPKDVERWNGMPMLKWNNM